MANVAVNIETKKPCHLPPFDDAFDVVLELVVPDVPVDVVAVTPVLVEDLADDVPVLVVPVEVVVPVAFATSELINPLPMLLPPPFKSLFRVFPMMDVSLLIASICARVSNSRSDVMIVPWFVYRKSIKPGSDPGAVG